MVESKGPIQSARDRMMGEIAEGTQEGESIDFSAKSILARGCDPQMALRASKVMPSLLGGVELVSCTDDDEFHREAARETVVCGLLRPWSVSV